MAWYQVCARLVADITYFLDNYTLSIVASAPKKKMKKNTPMSSREIYTKPGAMCNVCIRDL